MQWLATFSALAATTMVFTPWRCAQACSLIPYETGTGTYITRRSMDWNDPDVKTALWVFPRGMERDGGIGKNPIKWTSEYGSVVYFSYDAGDADGALFKHGNLFQGIYVDPKRDVVGVYFSTCPVTGDAGILPCYIRQAAKNVAGNRAP